MGNELKLTAQEVWSRAFDLKYGNKTFKTIKFIDNTLKIDKTEYKNMQYTPIRAVLEYNASNKA